MGKKKKSSKNSDGTLTVALNKQARRDYEILENIEAGLSLLGSEVKSIREAQVNLKESYVRVKNQELFLIGCHISAYTHASEDAHEATRERKLLLHRREIEKLAIQVQQKGLTLVPLRLYFKQGRCKLEIGVGRGRKLHDKRQVVKEREVKREMERATRPKPRRSRG